MKTYKILKIDQNFISNKAVMVLEMAEAREIAGIALHFNSNGDQFILFWESALAQRLLHKATYGDGFVEINISDFEFRQELDGGKLWNRYFHLDIFK